MLENKIRVSHVEDVTVFDCFEGRCASSKPWCVVEVTEMRKYSFKEGIQLKFSLCVHICMDTNHAYVCLQI